MKRIALPLIIMLYFATCKKDTITTNNNNNNNNNIIINNDTVEVISPDSIFYQSFSPQMEVYSVDTFTPYLAPGGYGESPHPGDSLAFLMLDVNGDLIGDLKFTARHQYTNNIYCSIHTPNVDYVITISGATLTDSILTDAGKLKTLYCDTTNTIGNGGFWNNHTYLTYYTTGCSGSVNLFFTEETYIGFKLNQNYGWVRIAPDDHNGVIITECGFNLTPNNPIKIGQKN